ncbi:hypothetical protein POM88_034441 [Heracleum sosnowskyi]|uniref:Helitron helicase-like domain-containing protein n=1 Tax=Heracleum sosnowskyi TaxID=360622 RepID=A0AAD8HJL0_9APIA|nr:hypothetical protein POM88_034441 [Heracleum sosnowskyi]
MNAPFRKTHTMYDTSNGDTSTNVVRSCSPSPQICDEFCTPFLGTEASCPINNGTEFESILRRNVAFLSTSSHTTRRTPLSDITNIARIPNDSESFNSSPIMSKRKGKRICIDSGRKLFTEHFVNIEEQSNDFDEGPSIVAGIMSSDESGQSDYECSESESSEYGSDSERDDDSEDDVFNENEMNSFKAVTQTTRGKRVVPEQYATLGAPSAICSKCNARMWKEERVNKNVTKGTPIFSLCCMKGAVNLPEVPLMPRYLMELYNDKKKGPGFHRMIHGFHPKIKFQKTVESSNKVRGYLSMKDFYSYSFQVRENDGLTPRLKLDQLMADIKNKAYFGVCIGVMYVVEFQKRGLPHVHMLIWLDKTSKKYAVYPPFSKEVLSSNNF